MAVNEIDLTVSPVKSISLTVEPDQVPVPMQMEQLRVRYESPYPDYTGPTSVTPSAQAQTLHTKDTALLSDITIGAIPQNYGLITWDGSTLTVS